MHRRLTKEQIGCLEQKTEELITQAINEGADVDFQDVRFRMEFGSKYRVQRPFSIAIAQLEEGIAAAKREKAKRASRRPFVFKLKNLIGL